MRGHLGGAPRAAIGRRALSRPELARAPFARALGQGAEAEPDRRPHEDLGAERGDPELPQHDRGESLGDLVHRRQREHDDGHRNDIGAAATSAASQAPSGRTSRLRSIQAPIIAASERAIIEK